MRRVVTFGSLLAGGLIMVAVARGPAPSFSQFPGFAAYYAANPPAATLPSPADRARVARFQPRLCLPDGHPGPIDFYHDYIAHGELRDGTGAVVATGVDPATLNRYVDDPSAVFRHRPADGSDRPVLYARVDRARIGFPAAAGAAAHDFTFITYTAVFRHSGLPAGLPSWQRFVLQLVASTTDWHQLDHYTAATVILDRTERPVAVTVQQHNHQRTYMVGRDLTWPADDRLLLDVAIGSNELYPHHDQPRRRRSVAFPDARGMRYLIAGTDPPLLAADDLTDCRHVIDPALRFLPPSDAFYRFAGFLGARRLLPGRDGPPGADYNTLPALKPLARQMFAAYWRPDHAGDLARFDAAVSATPNFVQALIAFADAQAAIFQADWQCARDPAQPCP